jgi:hypothetical protein
LQPAKSPAESRRGILLVQRLPALVALWLGRDLIAEHAEIWEDASSLIAGIKMLFGADPKDDYKDKVAKVALR